MRIAMAVILAVASVVAAQTPNLVKDINPGGASSVISHEIAFNDKLLFRAENGTNGNELWCSDGTPAGTFMLKDINPGATSSGISGFVLLNGALLFGANNGAQGSELWRTDGSAAGTALLSDINPGAASANPGGFATVGSVAYFRATTAAEGTELWKTDGTATGTVLVRDINPGVSGSSPDRLMHVAGTLFFIADDGVNGVELWMSDGTAAGTVMVKDIHPGASGSNPNSLTPNGQELYFFADDGAVGRELWKTDGTLGGTVLVKDINPGPGGSLTFNLPGMARAGLVYFQASDGTHGVEPWVSDGTSGGTQLLLDINPGAANSGAYQFLEFNGAIYFSATQPATGYELWKTDGTSLGTMVTAEATMGPEGSLSPRLVANDLLVLVGRDGVNSESIWISDGTQAGTYNTGPINITAGSTNIAWPVATSTRLYFPADDGVHGQELWAMNLPGNQPPTLTNINVIPGAAPGTPFQIAFQTLKDASNASDPDSLLLAFRIEEVLSGTTHVNGMPVIAAVTTVSVGDFITWTPPGGASGAAPVAAFSVTAFDGTLSSTPAIPVRIMFGYPEVKESSSDSCSVSAFGAPPFLFCATWLVLAAYSRRRD